MAREFASATLRWAHLTGMDVRPIVVAVAGTRPTSLGWFRDSLPDLQLASTDYRELLAGPDVDAVYCAVPHHLHAAIYGDVIRARNIPFIQKPYNLSDLFKTIRAMLKQKEEKEI